MATKAQIEVLTKLGRPDLSGCSVSDASKIINILMKKNGVNKPLPVTDAQIRYLDAIMNHYTNKHLIERNPLLSKCIQYILAHHEKMNRSLVSRLIKVIENIREGYPMKEYTYRNLNDIRDEIYKILGVEKPSEIFGLLGNKNESKVMNKKLIRLTESDLHKLVKESVNRILREHMVDNPLWDQEDDIIDQEYGDPDLNRSQYDTTNGNYRNEPSFHDEPSDFINPYSEEALWDELPQDKYDYDDDWDKGQFLTRREKLALGRNNIRI